MLFDTKALTRVPSSSALTQKKEKDSEVRVRDSGEGVMKKDTQKRERIKWESYISGRE